MMPHEQLGSMLVKAGLLTQEQLDKALRDKKNMPVSLGVFLVRQGLVTEEDVIMQVAKQLHVDRFVADQYPLDIGLGSVMPIELAQRYKAVPVQKKGTFLTVAMIDPSDITKLDALENLVQMEVEPVICTQQDFEQLIGRVYGKAVTLDGVLENLDDVEYSQEQDESESEEIKVSSLLDEAEGAPVVRLVNWIIAEAVNEGASDVHISPERDVVQLRFRVDGILKEQQAPPKAMFLHVISRIKILSKLDISITRIPQDGRFTLKIDGREINIRVSTIPTVNGENLVMRILDKSAGILTLEQMGMSEENRAKVEAAIVRPYGMVLTAGPTGSGKTTSLYSILSRLNRPEVNIMTVEDPVEYRMDRVRQVQLNERAGMTFASGLRSILRQDPDIVMVGEIRDAETARIAVQAALTGHIVLSTVHTNNAAGAVTRLVDMGIEPLLVSSVLLAAIAQRLVRRVCADCCVPIEPHADALAYWGLENDPAAHFMGAVGCDNCKQSGYRGRTGVYEILEVNEAIKDLIMSRAGDHEITRVAQERCGLITLKEAAARKIFAGMTTMEEAMLKVGM